LSIRLGSSLRRWKGLLPHRPPVSVVLSRPLPFTRPEINGDVRRSSAG